MKHLKLFESLNIERACQDLGLQDFQIVDGLVNVDGDVNISDRGLDKIPVKFGRVSGYFDCSHINLTNLKGAPESVGGDFYCTHSKLTSLEGAPNSVARDFVCRSNRLTSLEGAPNSVGGGFFCNNNKIIDFKVPEFSLNEKKVFICYDNPIYQIYSLFNTPKCIDLINEYSVIQGDRIIWNRLEEVFHGLGMEVPDPNKLKFEDFKLIF